MKKVVINSEKCIEYAGSDSEIDKPQRGRPKRAGLPDVNINTGARAKHKIVRELIPPCDRELFF